MADIVQAIKDIISLGLTGALILVIFGGLRGWWIYGYLYREKEQECEEERAGRIEAENKYVELLKADIQERRERDRTLDLITKAATRGKVE